MQLESKITEQTILLLDSLLLGEKLGIIQRDVNIELKEEKYNNRI